MLLLGHPHLCPCHHLPPYLLLHPWFPPRHHCHLRSPSPQKLLTPQGLLLGLSARQHGSQPWVVSSSHLGGLKWNISIMWRWWYLSTSPIWYYRMRSIILDFDLVVSHKFRPIVRNRLVLSELPHHPLWIVGFDDIRSSSLKHTRIKYPVQFSCILIPPWSHPKWQLINQFLHWFFHQQIQIHPILPYQNLGYYLF